MTAFPNGEFLLKGSSLLLPTFATVGIFCTTAAVVVGRAIAGWANSFVLLINYSFFLATFFYFLSIYFTSSFLTLDSSGAIICYFYFVTSVRSSFYATILLGILALA